jgi:carbamoyltransferase
MSDAILGISAYYHDSAAVLLLNGEIIAAAQEERFTRKKHDASFPINAVKYVLGESGLCIEDLSVVAFYDKPYLKFERLLETYHAFAPSGLKSFLSAIPVWIKEKLFMKKTLMKELSSIGNGKPKLLFSEHHLSHAASAFYPSPFQEAGILTIDGVGEWATTTISHGIGNEIKILKELVFPHSLGLLYSAFTDYCGFKVNSGEYKLMGLSPYGNPDSEQTRRFKKNIQEQLIDLREDGSFMLNMYYFNYPTGLTMCHEKRWEELFGICRRKPETELSQPYMDLSFAIQQVIEGAIFKLVKTAKELTKSDYLVLAGGVALNCVANGKLLRHGLFKDIWTQPAAGDAGGALGAAYAAWHIWKGKKRIQNSGKDKMQGAYLGPAFSDGDIITATKKYNPSYKKYQNDGDLYNKVAKLLDKGDVIGWFQGRMEYGPRALGNRSIIGDPRNPEMQKKLNVEIKYREGFRPFAPSVLEEDINKYFKLDKPSPYMLLVAPVNDDRRNPVPENYTSLEMYDRLYHLRSDIPAVTHVDYSARIQSVNKNTNGKYWHLINAFKEKTGYGVIVNTSFNVRGEPIVCNPKDAYICFMRTEMDWLVIENFLFEKKTQPQSSIDQNWIHLYELD